MGNCPCIRWGKALFVAVPAPRVRRNAPPAKRYAAMIARGAYLNPPTWIEHGCDWAANWRRRLGLAATACDRASERESGRYRRWVAAAGIAGRGRADRDRAARCDRRVADRQGAPAVAGSGGRWPI